MRITNPEVPGANMLTENFIAGEGILANQLVKLSGFADNTVLISTMGEAPQVVGVALNNALITEIVRVCIFGVVEIIAGENMVRSNVITTGAVAGRAYKTGGRTTSGGTIHTHVFTGDALAAHDHDVTPDTGAGGAHDHGSVTGAGGAHDHGAVTGAGDAHTHAETLAVDANTDVEPDGIYDLIISADYCADDRGGATEKGFSAIINHTKADIAKAAHAHSVSGAITNESTHTHPIAAESIHTHPMASESAHTHDVPTTDGRIAGTPAGTNANESAHTHIYYDNVMIGRMLESVTTGNKGKCLISLA